MNTDSSTEVRQAAELMALHARIEALEAALRRIRDDGKNCVDHCRRQADKALRTSARAAFDKDTGK